MRKAAAKVRISVRNTKGNDNFICFLLHNQGFIRIFALDKSINQAVLLEYDQSRTHKN